MRDIERQLSRINESLTSTSLGKCFFLFPPFGASDRLKFEHELVAGTANIADVISYLEDCMLRELSSWQLRMASPPNTSNPSVNTFSERTATSTSRYCTALLQNASSSRKPRPIVGGAGPPAPPSPSPSDSLPTLPFLIKRLNLVPTSEDATVDLRNPSSMNYVFSGAFTPPFCQVVANAMVHGWNTNELKKTFGRVLVEENSYIPADRRPDNRMRKAILVFFLGGVTYAE
ncbi:hypothetical protein OSTOST_24985, partial [Ostertagia ostertagi]